MILGLVMLYCTGHFFAIQHTTAFKDRTTYEKVVTWVALVSIVLVYFSVMSS